MEIKKPERYYHYNKNWMIVSIVLELGLMKILRCP